MSSWQETFDQPEKVVKAEMLGIKITAKKLREMYQDESMTCAEIGEELGCSSDTVRNLLEEAGIERRSARGSRYGERKYQDEDWLRKQYEEKQNTAPEIAAKCDCATSTIYRKISKYNLEAPVRDPYSDKKYRDEDWLREQFLEENKSPSEIADDLNVHKSTIANWINEFGIREELPIKCNFYLSSGGSMFGYPKWTATGAGCPHQLLVHSLVMIREGADPEKVFGDNKYQVHHRNGFKCDNRASNLELVDRKTHGRHHTPDNKKWTDDDMLAAMRLMMDPSELLDE